MTRMTRPDCAVTCNLINIHTYDRAGLRGYVQFNKYIHTFVISIIDPPSGGSMRVA